MKTTTNMSPLTQLLLSLSADAILSGRKVTSISEIAIIEAREKLFTKIDEAMNSSYAFYKTSKAFVSAEMRADENETLALRNTIGLKACDSILYLNQKCKEVTGRKFLKNYYRIDDVKIKQKNIQIFYDCMKEYDVALENAITQLNSKAANY